MTTLTCLKAPKNCFPFNGSVSNFPNGYQVSVDNHDTIATCCLPCTESPLRGDGTAGNCITFLDGGVAGDTWIWDGTTWILGTAGSTVFTLAPITGNGSIVDPVRLIDGNNCNDMLQWSTLTTAWRILTPPSIIETTAGPTLGMYVSVSQAFANGCIAVKIVEDFSEGGITLPGPGDYTVYIPPGVTYTLTAPTNFTASNLNILGVGDPPGTLAYSFGASSPVFVSASTLDHFHIENLTIDNNSSVTDTPLVNELPVIRMLSLNVLLPGQSSGFLGVSGVIFNDCSIDNITLVTRDGNSVNAIITTGSTSLIRSNDLHLITTSGVATPLLNIVDGQHQFRGVVWDSAPAQAMGLNICGQWSDFSGGYVNNGSFLDLAAQQDNTRVAHGTARSILLNGVVQTHVTDFRITSGMVGVQTAFIENCQFELDIGTTFTDSVLTGCKFSGGGVSITLDNSHWSSGSLNTIGINVQNSASISGVSGLAIPAIVMNTNSKIDNSDLTITGTLTINTSCKITSTHLTVGGTTVLGSQSLLSDVTLVGTGATTLQMLAQSYVDTCRISGGGHFHYGLLCRIANSEIGPVNDFSPTAVGGISSWLLQITIFTMWLECLHLVLPQLSPEI
jgi:hypothetical protein